MVTLRRSILQVLIISLIILFKPHMTTAGSHAYQKVLQELSTVEFEGKSINWVPFYCATPEKVKFQRPELCVKFTNMKLQQCANAL